jgi:acetyl esterase/lipase
VFGSFEKLPPILVLVGEPEVLLDDAVRIVERARAAKVPAELQIMPQMQHVWPIAMPWLSESREAMQAISSFLSNKT